MAIGLAKTNHNTQFGIYEIEKVKEFAEKNIEANGLTNRISAISGKFLDSVAEGFDCIALKHIVHDWKDESAGLILKNCRKALSPGNKLFVIDMIIDKNSTFYRDQVQNDLIMVHYLGSKERTLPEFEKLLLEAGFRIEKVSEVLFENVIQAIAI